MKANRLAPFLLLATLAACKQPAPPAPAPYPFPVALNGNGTPVDPAHSFTVTGTATLEVAPDTAELRMTLSSEASKPGAATRAARAKQAKLIAALAEVGVPESDLKLSYLNINPVYHPESGKIRGYQASIMVTASSKDFDKVGPMMEAAADAGATQMDSYFRADLAALKSKVRDMALEAAKDKAEQISESLDVALGKVVGINELGANDTWSYYGEGYYYSRAAVPNAWDLERGVQMPTINPELQPLTLSISLTYQLS
jgi:hypothetical protein